MGLTGKLSAAVLAAIFALSLSSFVISPYDPDAIDLDHIKERPSLSHPLGTDNKGRDVFARVLSGGKLSLGISVGAALLSMVLGLTIGLISGYAGGCIDTALMAIVDLVLAFPALLLAIGVSVIFPPGVSTVVIALAAVGWASFARIVRGHVLTLREAPYIDAARSIGCGDVRIVVRHILPQCIPLAVVLTGLRLGGYILSEAALSFLGLGAQPPTATWGAMISANRAYIRSAPWTVFPPGVLITVSALCFNLLGDDFRRKFELLRREGVDRT